MKKLNLEQIGVQELTTVENREIDGGLFGVDDLILIAAGALLGALLTQDLDDLGDAFMEGYNAGRH